MTRDDVIPLGFRICPKGLEQTSRDFTITVAIPGEVISPYETVMYIMDEVMRNTVRNRLDFTDEITDNIMEGIRLYD